MKPLLSSLASLGLFVCLGCNTTSTELPTLKADEMTFVGGADGGVYVTVTDDANPNDNLYQGKILHDDKSSVWYEGPLKLIDSQQALGSNNALRPTGWDGDRLYLSDGGYLLATEAPE